MQTLEGELQVEIQARRHAQSSTEHPGARVPLQHVLADEIDEVLAVARRQGPGGRRRGGYRRRSLSDCAKPAYRSLREDVELVLDDRTPSAEAAVHFPSSVFAAVTARLLRAYGPIGMLAVPFVWTATEFARYWLTGNNWNALGYSQAFAPGPRQLAAVGGILEVVRSV